MSQNKRKPSSVVMYCRFCCSKWIILSDLVGFAPGFACVTVDAKPTKSLKLAILSRRNENTQQTKSVNVYCELKHSHYSM